MATATIRRSTPIQIVELLTSEGDRLINQAREDRRFKVYCQGAFVGTVEFVRNARGYTFLPDDCTFFNEDGLRQLADFLKRINQVLTVPDARCGRMVH